MKTLLSLFDYSGNWSQPFAEEGWNIIQWDIKISTFMNINLITNAEEALDLFGDVDGILAAVPCTEFTNSCAQYWKAKDEDGRTEEALKLVYQVLRLVDLFRPTDPDYDDIFFWAIENPVGRINKLIPELGLPYYFNPCDFAGWNSIPTHTASKLDTIRLKNGINVSDKEADLIRQYEAYTKRTGLWGEFNHNLKRMPIEPVKACKQGSVIQRFGGSSETTKEIRSYTPRGFAKAFFEANKNYSYRKATPQLTFI